MMGLFGGQKLWETQTRYLITKGKKNQLTKIISMQNLMYV